MRGRVTDFHAAQKGRATENYVRSLGRVTNFRVKPHGWMPNSDFQISRESMPPDLPSLQLLNPSTPKSNQFHIYPAASQEYYTTQYEEFGFP